MLFDHGEHRLDAKLPNSYAVTIHYEGPTGRKYEENQLLDLSPMVGMEAFLAKGIHDIGQELESIRKTLGNIERHLKR
jgi:hypothetical protein